MSYDVIVSDAIIAIKPTSHSCKDNDVDQITWEEGETPILREDIIAKMDLMQAEWDAQEYARDRKEEYDALNQFEMQYDDKANDTTTWDDAIEAIKAKYPKP